MGGVAVAGFDVPNARAFRVFYCLFLSGLLLFLNVGISPLYTVPNLKIKSLETVSLLLEDKVWLTHPIICRYAWYYDGTIWNWEVQVQPSLYIHFQQKSRLNSGTGDIPAGFVNYITSDLDFDPLKIMAAELKRVSGEEGFSPRRELEFVSCFVGVLQYYDDLATTGVPEYPRYPVETLVDSGGDCEDKAILLASLLNLMDYDVKLILSTNHCAVSVLDPGDLCGDYYFEGEKRYYFIETTTPAGCGKKSDQFKNGFRIFQIEHESTGK
jgi:hypothetical protein